MSKRVVDLTLSDSDEDDLPQKRQRQGQLNGYGSHDAPICLSDDDDVQLQTALQISIQEHHHHQEQQHGRQQQPPSGSAAEEAAEDEDEDLVITGDVGVIANRDLPHLRHDCAVHKFAAGGGTSNAQHCGQCYCWVCDCEASKCQFWGTGTSSKHHCNARAQTPYWDRIRRLKRDGNMAAVRAEYSGAATPVALPPAAAAAAAAGPLPAARAATAVAAAAAAADRPRAQDRLSGLLQHMAAVQGAQDPVAQARLNLGLAPMPSRKEPLPDKPVRALTQVPDPANDPDVFELGTVRLPVKVVAAGETIASLCQRLIPCGYYDYRPGEPVGNKLLLDTIFDRTWDQTKHKHKFKTLKLLPHPEPEALAAIPTSRVRKITVVHYDGRAAAKTIGVTVENKCSPSQLAAAVGAVLQPPLGASERILIMQGTTSNMHVNTYHLADDRQLGDGSFAHVRTWAFRVPKPSRPSSAHPSDSYATPEYLIISNHRGSDYDGRNELHPVVLPISAEHLRGGAAANKAVADALARAVQPYLKPGQLAVKVPFTLKRCGYQHEQMGPFCEARGAPLRALSPGNGSYVAPLDACWREQQATMYDLAVFASPAVDDSASADALKETVEREEALRKREVEQRQLKEKPRNFVQELIAATPRSKPNTPAALRTKPSLSYSLTLVPAAGEGSGKRGTAVFRLYTWRYSGTHNDTVFEDFDASWAQRSYMPCAYATIMELLAVQAERGREMYRLLSACRSSSHGCHRGLQGLIDSLTTEERPAAVQPAGLTVQLRPYQLQSLEFMLETERRAGGFRGQFWLQYTNNKQQSYWWSPVFQRVCKDVPSMPYGGWLAEEMGLGKTVEVLGLVLAAKPPDTLLAGQKSSDGYVLSRATLVVCAVSLVGQWIDEARSKSAGSLRIHMYHGQSRCRDPMKLACDYDIVVTTYQTLGADCGSRGRGAGPADPKAPIDVKGSPVGSIRWYRIIMDEGHTVKNAAVRQSKVMFGVQSERRWLCTGTPINNAVADLYGQFCALQLAPADKKAFFDLHWKNLYAGGRPGSASTLAFILKSTLIRHTKHQVLGGEEVLQLPPKTEEEVAVVMGPEERQLYMKVHQEAKAEWLKHRALGVYHVTKNLLAIQSLFQPLRRIASGGLLAPREIKVPMTLVSEEAAGGAGSSLAKDSSLVSPETECSICMDGIQEPTMTPCKHWFCKECIMTWMETRQDCPQCRAAMQVSSLTVGTTAEQAALLAGSDPAAGAPSAALHACESKLAVLVAELRAMRAADPSSKALIFSNFNSTIAWLQQRLPAEGFQHRTISGNMPQTQRARAIDAFQKDPPTTVFLISMRSGAVGINLTAASHVFIMEPCLNRALEEQAVGRAWRMGQTRSVTVKRLYVAGSIEQRIMEVTKQKFAHKGSDTGDDYDDALAALMVSGRGRPKKRVDDPTVPGNITSDSTSHRLRQDELDKLFEDPGPELVNGVKPAGAAGAGGAAGAASAAGGSGLGQAAAGTGSVAAATAGPSAAGATAAAVSGNSGRRSKQRQRSESEESEYGYMR